MEDITRITKELLAETEKCHDRFMMEGKPEKERDFFNHVKKEADPIFALIDKWEGVSLQMIQNKELSLHPQQVNATKENMQSLILHSYYKDTRKRRFIEIYKSCYYIFAQQLENLSTNQTEK